MYQKGNCEPLYAAHGKGVGLMESFDVQDVINAGCNLDFIECRHCGDVEGNVTFNQSIGDAYCVYCGEWQL